MGFLFKEPWHLAWIEKCADPTDHRTQKEFCESYGLKPSTLSSWIHREPTAINYEIDKRRKEYVTQIRQKAWKALDKKLDKGSDKAIELCFKLLGDFVERSEQKIDYMRPEDKIERIKELLSRITDEKTPSDEKSNTPTDGDRSDAGPRPAENNGNVG